MRANPGVTVASASKNVAVQPKGLTPHIPPAPNAANSAASSVPNADYRGKGGSLATIAQTKYGAPPGWATPAGTKAEGIEWTTPTGKSVRGTAPAVFRRG